MIKLNKNLYSQKTILSAVNAFSEIARIRIKEDKSYYILEIDSEWYDELRVMKELENYMIDSENVIGDLE